MTSKEYYPAFVNFDRYKHIYLLSFIQMIYVPISLLLMLKSSKLLKWL